jgi:formate dehydrogenase subunit delta
VSADSLVKMANDIGRFFASEPRRADAVAGIAMHLKRSWEPRMLRKIAAHVREGGAGLDDLPREAVISLDIPPTTAGATGASAAAPAAEAPAGGGDAGSGRH